jgi:hypothetical protein
MSFAVILGRLVVQLLTSEKRSFSDAASQCGSQQNACERSVHSRFSAARGVDPGGSEEPGPPVWEMGS